jgi:hypothetical protein
MSPASYISRWVTSKYIQRGVRGTLAPNSLTLALSCPAFTNQILALTPIARLHEMLPASLIRRSYWLDMTDRTLVMVMVNGIGAHLTNDEKRAHLTDLKRDNPIDQVCVQEILPPEK